MKGFKEAFKEGIGYTLGIMLLLLVSLLMICFALWVNPLPLLIGILSSIVIYKILISFIIILTLVFWYKD